MRCDGCGEPFEPRRRDQRFCSAPCRQQGFARIRADRAREALAAVDRLRAWIVAEVTRWEAAGQRRRGPNA